MLVSLFVLYALFAWRIFPIFLPFFFFVDSVSVRDFVSSLISRAGIIEREEKGVSNRIFFLPLKFRRGI